MNLQEKEQKEINFYKDSEHENPRNFTIPNLCNKMAEARIFLEKLCKYEKEFLKANTILELGAAQGWASCIVKKTYPHKNIYVSDISPYALASVPQWERIFTVALEKKITCRAQDIPLESASVDLIFCFQSAHHFVEHEKVLAEVYRILKRGGKAIFLYEPSCNRFVYPLARKRVVAKNSVEDLLEYKKMQEIASRVGFSKAEVEFYASTTNRQFLAMCYYGTLMQIPFLRKILPCTADYIFTKEY